jgi:hypothetical protein
VSTGAQAARALVDGACVATLATLGADGVPWASMVTYGVLPDGSPVLCVSRLAEHGRSLERDPRGSLLVTAPVSAEDPLASGRVTLAGRFAAPADPARARAAYVAGVPRAAAYVDFEDFSLWVLSVERVRWVGGYGRMESVAAGDYARASVDPVALQAGPAIAHLNADHSGALLDIARALGGHPGASAARCSGLDRQGMDLVVRDREGSRIATRVVFAHELTGAEELRAATVELTRRARAALGEGDQ